MRESGLALPCIRNQVQICFAWFSDLDFDYGQLLFEDLSATFSLSYSPSIFLRENVCCSSQKIREILSVA